MFRSACLPVAALVLSATLLPADADAALANRQFVQNAPAACHAATADTAFRYRPRALQNEGASAQFVSCSFATQGSYGPTVDNPLSFSIYASVIDGVADSITCTATLGYAYDGFALPVSTKTLALPAQTDTLGNEIRWTPADFGVATQQFPTGLLNVSCLVNPGVSLNDTYIFFQETF